MWWWVAVTVEEGQKRQSWSWFGAGREKETKAKRAREYRDGEMVKEGEVTVGNEKWWLLVVGWLAVEKKRTE